MLNVDEQIKISNDAICRLLDASDEDERGALSQDILNNLRTLVEAVAVKASGENEYDWENIHNGVKQYIPTRADLKFLRKFHKFLQQTISHYLPNEENSERLMLKYYEYLLQMKSFLKKEYDIDILGNIEKFPLHTDPALKEYYEKIAEKINLKTDDRKKSSYTDRYYVTKVKPFFVDYKVYYEITFTTAVDYVSKFDRVIAFTNKDILPNYAVKLSISNDVIDVLGKKMPIQIIDNWEVSIRPCELNNFADIFGQHPKISSGSLESRRLMNALTEKGLNLVEVVELSNEDYEEFKQNVLLKTKANHLFNILDICRDLINSKKGGFNVVSYLLYRLNNKIIKAQYSTQENHAKLPNINLRYGCIPFDELPYNTSLIGHNPRIQDLLDCINPSCHEYELLARHVKNNTEQKGDLYTHRDVIPFEDVDSLISEYNQKLYYKHRPYRSIETYKKYLYINGYEQDTLHIIEKLKELASDGIKNYSNSIESWIKSGIYNIDCEEKKKILRQIFENSHVALIYGSAGTGKTTLINHISSFHNDFRKLYLANTNPAVHNLQRRITAGNTTFKTISRFLYEESSNAEYDILFVDECSTVSNADMIEILRKSSFKLLVLVGDVYQIESILFGNWFAIARSFLPKESVFELTNPYRTSNARLLELWEKVRNIESDILEHITNNNYSARLDSSIFDYSEDDEIILCLNYDGLYGINNINRFLQGSNPNESVQWGIHTYKINDPILFNENNRFKPIIHNNLKGRIVGIERQKDMIWFNTEIDMSINQLDIDIFNLDLEIVGDSDEGKTTIRFYVNKLMSTDEDENSSASVVPFQIAYAVSMHKAQGLEYSSVKVVITDEVEEQITHNIFYTAITRTKEKLKIYWTPETEKTILSSLEKKFNNKDVHLLKTKFKI